MSSKTVDLSKAIVATINAATYSIKFEAKRRVVPFSNIEEIKSVSVVVFDGTKAAERITRTEFQRTYKPTLAILQKMASGDDASRLVQSDALQNLVEQLEESLEDVDLAGLSFVGFDEEQERDPYNVELMKSHGAFAVAITLEYSG